MCSTIRNPQYFILDGQTAVIEISICKSVISFLNSVKELEMSIVYEFRW